MSDPLTSALQHAVPAAEGARTMPSASIAPPSAPTEARPDPQRQAPRQSPAAEARTQESRPASPPARNGPSEAELLAIATRARVLLRAAYAGLSQSVFADQAARRADSSARARDVSLDERTIDG